MNRRSSTTNGTSNLLSAAEIKKRRLFGENNINAGRLREFPWICIDKFYGEHLRATIFILSHCHTDHMVGLDEDEFWNRLNEPGVHLYLHRITPVLLPLFNNYLRGEEGIRMLISTGKIVPLDINKPFDIHEPASGTTVKMTLLSAGHCPGSVMFQFEFDQHCILYTGDCRVSVKDLKTMKSLYLSNSSDTSRKGTVEKTLKSITHLYIDTTFCSTRSQHFPGRADAVDRLVETIESWLNLSRNNYVNLMFAARFAHEYVLHQCFKKFGIQYHVNPQRYEAYRRIPELFPAVTLNSNSRFHLCDMESPCLINLMNGRPRGKVLKIKLTSLWYMKNKNGLGPKNALKYEKDKSMVTICYAMHSSLDEITAMIDYLKPKVLTPLVLPKGMDRKELKSELRRKAWGNYVYEDYEKGLESSTILNVKQPLAVAVTDSIVVHDNPSTSPSSSPPPKRAKRQLRWTPSPSPPPA